MRILTTFLTFFFLPVLLCAQEPEDENTMMAYVVIVDTSQDYHFLQRKMEKWGKDLDVEVDMMGRSYDEEKDLICLAEDDEDEIYAGDYYPRRYTGDFLSLEYIVMYEEKAGEKTIGLIAGIFEDELTANNRLNRFKKNETQAHVVYTKLYIGCIH